MMPLSDYEQRMLAQMEAQLHADDPHLAETLGDSSGPDLRKVALGALVAVAGIGALVGGVATGWIWLGVLGFAAMVGGVLLGMTPGRTTRSKGTSPGAGPGGRGGRGGTAPRRPGPSGGRSASTKSFMERQQEKWEQRGEGRGV